MMVVSFLSFFLSDGSSHSQEQEEEEEVITVDISDKEPV